MAALIVFTTVPAEQAQRLATALLEQHLVACVNVLPGVRSLYHWDGHIESAEESLLLLKCSNDGYPQLQSALQALHPYEVPEIIAVPISAGLPAYLNWVEQNCRGGEPIGAASV
ncbi:MAG: divalent-cation tolerance protein CutA [Xanthomonadales bacterium]|nr:divalent-cation tolerance protein CutA [Xanthomonadales bacterium]